jgi:hypothetical protein
MSKKKAKPPPFVLSPLSEQVSRLRATGDETSLRIADALGPGCSDVCLSSFLCAYVDVCDIESPALVTRQKFLRVFHGMKEGQWECRVIIYQYSFC